MHMTMIKGRQGGDGTAWVNHNSDFSGEAYLGWRDANGNPGEVAIPGWVAALTAFDRTSAIELLEEAHGNLGDLLRAVFAAR